MAAQLALSMMDHPHWLYDQDKERDGIAIGRRRQHTGRFAVRPGVGGYPHHRFAYWDRSQSAMKQAFV